MQWLWNTLAAGYNGSSRVASSVVHLKVELFELEILYPDVMHNLNLKMEKGRKEELYFQFTIYEEEVEEGTYICISSFLPFPSFCQGYASHLGTESLIKKAPPWVHN